MEIQDQIYCIMQEKKMKQSLVAKSAGYSPKDFNNMLRKRKSIKPEDILPICSALDVTPNELFGWQAGEQPRERAG